MAKKKSSKIKKLTGAALFDDLCSVLDRGWAERLDNMAAPFLEDIRVLRRPGEPVRFYRMENQYDAHPADIDTVAALLADYSGMFEGQYTDAGWDITGAHLTHQLARKVVEAWAHRTKERAFADEPAPFGLKNEAIVCLAQNRLSYELAEWPFSLKAKAPNFYSMLKRIETNRRAFICRVGSIYDRNADRKQAIWLWGAADAGKSTFEELLNLLVGKSAFASLGKDELEERWWKSSLVGKRLLLVQEAATGFAQTDGFKSLVGDLHHTVNEKYLKPYVATLNVIVFFFSNQEPRLSSDESILKRVIDCRIRGIPDSEQVPISEMIERYRAELPYIAAFCWRMYLSLVGSGKRLPVCQRNLRELSEEHEERYIEFLQDCFIFEQGALMRSKAFEQIMRSEGFSTNAERGKCRAVLQRKYNIKSQRNRSKNADVFVLRGMRPAPGYARKWQEEQELMYERALDDEH